MDEAPNHPLDGYAYSGCDCDYCEDIRAWMIPFEERQKRRERKVLDNRRSVFLQQRLATEPSRRRVSRRKRGAS
jgi:hypothetical protein